MNPNPFSELNHLTVPVGMRDLLHHGQTDRAYLSAAVTPDISPLNAAPHGLDGQHARHAEAELGARSPVMRHDRPMADLHRTTVVALADRAAVDAPAGLDE